LHKEHEVSA